MDLQEAKEILCLWGEEPVEIKQVRDAFQVTTKRGNRCLKPLKQKAERINFVSAVMKHLKDRGFNRMAMYIPSLEGHVFEEYKGTNYIVQEWLEGKEPDYRNEDEMFLAAKTLALCHQAGAGFSPGKGIKVKNNLGKWPQKLEENLADLESFLSRAQSSSCPTGFERALVSQKEWLRDHARRSIRRLNEGPYFSLVEEARGTGSLIHGDPATRNFILISSEMNLIDFDSSAIDINIVDLWKLLRRTMRRNNWQLNLLEKLLEGYEKHISLGRIPLSVLLAFLEFPERVWRITREYYEKQALVWWDEAELTEKLSEYFAQQEEIDGFLNGFIKKIY